MALAAALLIGLLTPFLVFDPHVRSESAELRALVREGVQQSRTLSALVDRLQSSDVVVYLEYEYAPPHDVAGAVTFLSAAGGRRYLRIRIRWDLLRRQQLAILGHELRHAIEIAESPDVVDSPSLAARYRRIGVESSSRRWCFDTDAAVETGWRVHAELSGNRSTESLQRRHKSLPGMSSGEGIH